MLIPLLLMLAAYKTFYIYVALMGVRNEIIESEYNTAWVKKLLDN